MDSMRAIVPPTLPFPIPTPGRSRRRPPGSPGPRRPAGRARGADPATGGAVEADSQRRKTGLVFVPAHDLTPEEEERALDRLEERLNEIEGRQKEAAR